MSKILIIVSFASMLFGADIMNTDFIPRLVNFVIFISIAYYLVGDKLKHFLSSRREDIQTSLSKAQEKLSNSKKQKSQALVKIQESEKMALEIIKNAKDECKNISKTYQENTRHLIASLKKSFDDRMELDTRQVKIEVVKEVLDELLDDALNNVSQDRIMSIINERFAS